MHYRALRSKGFILPSRIQAAGSPYESGSATGSRSRNWNPSSAGPSTAAATNLPMVRRRARDAVRNDPWAKTAANRWVSNAIGTGIQPYSKHPDKASRLLLKELWADWVPEADADGRMDFYGLQALAVRSMFVDGETLARLRPRRLTDGLSVPLQIQALEGDLLPVEDTHVLGNGNEVVNGVEFNTRGQRVNYHLWNRHPGDPAGRQFLRKRAIPAESVVHAYPILRPGQVRGVSELATVLLRLKTLDSFDDAVAFRQEVSNLFAGFITRPRSEDDPNDPLGAGSQADFDDDDTPLASLEPGTLQQLADGEDVRFANPPGAPDSYAEFMRQQLMAAFASVGIPYEIGTGDLRGVSDRTLRVLVNEFHRQIEQYQWTCFIHQWCRPIWNAWLDMLAMSGLISAADYARNRRQWQRVLWVPEGWPYFNPVQDVKAKTDEIRAGLISRSAVILAQGEDPEAVIDQIAQDNDAADAIAAKFDSDSRYSRNGARDEPESPSDSSLER